MTEVVCISDPSSGWGPVMLDMSIRATIDRILQLPDLVGPQIKSKIAHQDAVPRRCTRITDEHGANDNVPM